VTDACAASGVVSLVADFAPACLAKLTADK